MDGNTLEKLENEDENFKDQYTNEMIIMKSENLLVEAKVVSENSSTEDNRELGQTFNPTEQSRPEDIYDDAIPLNETTRQFIFKLLKSSVENFYSKVKERQDVLDKEEEQANKIAEYENELRLLKDWNTFVLMNMNRENIMDSYENCVLAIEKYLICELAKYTDVEDINVYYTYDFQNLLKIKNDMEIVQEEVTEELSEKLTEDLYEQNDEKSPRQNITKCVSVVYNDLQHYFVINTEVSLPEKANFVVKIEYREEQEGLITTNTLQILSNVFLQTLSHFLNMYYKEAAPVYQSQIFKTLLELKSGENHVGRNMSKEDRNKLLTSADNIFKGLGHMENLADSIPLRISFGNIKDYAFRNRRETVLEKLTSIMEHHYKKKALKNWRDALCLWKRKITSLKKLLVKGKLKITRKVLNKWYNQYKFEESMYQSVSHRDYIISMYEILGNTQNMKQFEAKYSTVFSFMINRYLKQWLHKDTKNSLKKVILALKKDKSTFVMLDFSEEEKTKVKKNNFISPIKDNKNLPDYVNAMMSNMSSPSNSGRITPVHQQIFIEDRDFLTNTSPQNYSFLVPSTKNQVKGNFLQRIDASSDYIVRQCVENPHCSKITNLGIIMEALANRAGVQKVDPTWQKEIKSCMVIPIKIGDDGDMGDVSDTMDMHSYSKCQIGILELYFSQPTGKLDLSQFEDDNCLHSLSPIFNLMKDIVLNDAKAEEMKELEESKIEESQSQTDESKISISASFLEANKKTYQDALMYFTQTTKFKPAFFQLLSLVSQEIPKILQCEKSLIILVVETPNSNILGGTTKTAYIHSPKDNYTYNFNYDGTFVDKILDSNRPVTFTAPNSSGPALALPASIKNSAYGHFPKNISNESYHTIRYLPVNLLEKGTSRIVGILETCYSESTVTNVLLNQHNDHSYMSDITDEEEKFINILDQNTSLLSGFADAFGKSEIEDRKISLEHKNVEFQCTKIIGKRLLKISKKLKTL